MTEQSPGRYRGSVPAAPTAPAGQLDLVVSARSGTGPAGTSTGTVLRDDSGPVTLRTTAQPYYAGSGTSVRVVASIEDVSGVSFATLHYSLDGSTWSSTAMSLGRDYSTDLDGDDGCEVVASYNTNGKLAVLSGVDLSVDWSKDLGTSYVKPMAAGDLDGDGSVELVVGDRVATNGVTLVVFRYAPSTGTYDAVFTYVAPTDAYVTAVCLGDIDGDGALEVVRAEGGATLIVSEWDGRVLTDVHTTAVNVQIYDMEVIDWDGDGIAELVTTDHSSGGRVRVFHWDGSGLVQEYVSSTISTSGTSSSSWPPARTSSAQGGMASWSSERSGRTPTSP
jgi:hypothetical protein